jgi:uncharacterized RDD family membrane protein YckC
MPPEPKKRKKESILSSLTIPGLYLIIFAVCGWLVLMANMFGFAGASGWIFPVVADIPGLAASTIFLALLGLTPLAIKQVLAGKRRLDP